MVWFVYYYYGISHRQEWVRFTIFENLYKSQAFHEHEVKVLCSLISLQNNCELMFWIFFIE